MNKFLPVKTFIIAGVLILLFGLIFLGGLYYLLNSDIFYSQNLINYIPVTRKPTSLHLEINSPDDNLVVFDPSLLVAGKTSPKATVIISSKDDDFGTEADQKGEFSKIIGLSRGLNRLNIVVFNVEGENKIVSKTIYYSKEEL